MKPSQIAVLQVTCAKCGHVREFEHDDGLTVHDLEDICAWPCIHCETPGGAVLSFFSCTAASQRRLERQAD